MGSQLHKKTKDCYYNIGRPEDCYASLGDLFNFSCKSCHVDELDLEEGDEIEISWTYEKVVVKKWGVHISYYTMDDTRLKID